MSTQTVREFWQKASQDPKLEQKLIGLPLDPDEWAAIMVRVSREAGYSLTADEFHSALKEEVSRKFAAGELSDVQLESVAGGAYSGTPTVSSMLATCVKLI